MCAFKRYCTHQGICTRDINTMKMFVPFNPYMVVLRCRKLDIPAVIILLLASVYLVTLFLTFENYSDKTIETAVDYAEFGQYKISTVRKRIEQRQIERQRRLKDYCTRHPETSRGKEIRPRDLAYLIVNDKYKVIYCYVPKVACTQWKRLFLALENLTNVTDEHAESNFKLLRKYSVEGIEMRLQSYYKFLFVREPFERLLSAYENKFVKRQWPWYKIYEFEKNIYEKFNQVDPNDGWNVTFKRFVYFLNDFGFNEDSHWAPYSTLCYPCDIKYDFIGHFEEMPEEAPYILKKTGMEKEVAFPDFVTHNTTSKLLQKYAPIPKDKIAELGKAFKEDFEMFNYDFPGPLSSLMGD